VFLIADAVLVAKAQQKTPDGYYNVERMLKRVLSGKGNVLLCGTCMDARGLSDTELLEGARRHHGRQWKLSRFDILTPGYCRYRGAHH
jgi:uncharacterized protein involved in oxidation of intracellular sulfur